MRALTRRWFYALRTEGSGAGREAAAIGVGIFIGCLPFYGFHFLLCWVVGWLFGLNRLKVYIAANISNPLMAPTLIFVEVQAGAWIRRGRLHSLSVEALQETGLSVFWYDVLTGSVALGALLGATLATVTFLSLKGTHADAAFLELVRETADRYMTSSIMAWEFARGKLRGDPVYRNAVAGGLLPTGGTLLDIGCGGGLALAILADASHCYASGRWPRSWSPPPRFDRLVGIESRAKAARVATDALGTDATIVHGDALVTPLPPCRAVLLFDVLHMMRAADQEALIAAVANALEPGGVMLVREADPSRGWRFVLVRSGNALKALVFGHWRQRFKFRTPDEWVACFTSQGLAARVRPMGQGTPFANVLFEVMAPLPVSATSHQSSQTA